MCRKRNHSDARAIDARVAALDERHKQRILARRDTIVTHEDEARYVDTPEHRCGREHTDVGIGIAFPL